MTREINRSALVVRLRKPYLDWAASLDEDARIHAEGLEKRVSIYLLAEDPKGKQETAPIENYYEEIFELELAAWSEDKTQWPKLRNLKMFQEWFEAIGESVVTDLESSPIKVEQACPATLSEYRSVKKRFASALKKLRD